MLLHFPLPYFFKPFKTKLSSSVVNECFFCRFFPVLLVCGEDTSAFDFERVIRVVAGSNVKSCSALLVAQFSSSEVEELVQTLSTLDRFLPLI